MLIVDASCLYEVVASTSKARTIRDRMLLDPDWLAPHVLDAEVVSVIRRREREGVLDPSAAWQAVDELHDWPGQRIGHQPLLRRAWELRANVRMWDALYVALAEILRAPLVTLDERLATATGPRCTFEVLA